jgi:chorismate mutase / prephenate dehydratase
MDFERSKMTELSELRKKLDEIDSDIVKLYEKRMSVVNDVAEYKSRSGKAIYDKSREEEKIASLESLTDGDFNKTAVKELFTQLMVISRRYQIAHNFGDRNNGGDTTGNGPWNFNTIEGLSRNKDIRVAFFGPRGSYTQAALEECFGNGVEEIEKLDFESVTKAVEDGYADYGVLPIENTTTGGINDSYDILPSSRNYIVAEHVLKIKQTLSGLKGAALDDITEVYSHEQAIMQCRAFLKEHGNMKPVAGGSTAFCAKKIRDDCNAAHAVICGEACAKEYGLEILADGINYEQTNSTRFIIFTRERIRLKNAGIISVCFCLPHKSGSLYNLLSNIIYNGLNMTRIESRPILGKNFEYKFFVDFEGNLNDPAVINTLNGIAAESTELKLLGNYCSL